mmetsp:Transcript_12977/g.34395  ORF Transcript_12977/g.34395 Transcript_12977/m.34395 type:complete len:83 (+) Transcript_12977:1652-1900(+)
MHIIILAVSREQLCWIVQTLFCVSILHQSQRVMVQVQSPRGGYDFHKSRSYFNSGHLWTNLYPGTEKMGTSMSSVPLVQMCC